MSIPRRLLLRNPHYQMYQTGFPTKENYEKSNQEREFFQRKCGLENKLGGVIGAVIG